MTSPTPDGGPPVRLYTRSERRRRRRVIVTAVAIVASFAVIITVLTLTAVTKPNVQVNLGSNTFRVGEALALERRIGKDNYPLLFQDLRDKSIDIFVDHQKGEHFYEAWRAIEAHAPGQPRTCQLVWTGTEYRDPCTDATYPSSGAGLRRFKTTVVHGEVIVDFRHPA
jgi:hypothetical protein